MTASNLEVTKRLSCTFASTDPEPSYWVTVRINGQDLGRGHTGSTSGHYLYTPGTRRAKPWAHYNGTASRGDGKPLTDIQRRKLHDLEVEHLPTYLDPLLRRHLREREAATILQRATDEADRIVKRATDAADRLRSWDGE